LWFIVVNVVLKTQMTQRYALTAEHPFTRSVSGIQEAHANTKVKSDPAILEAVYHYPNSQF